MNTSLPSPNPTLIADINERDGGCCVYCGSPTQVFGHLMDERLWDGGGWFADNMVSLCTACSILANNTMISPCELREAAGIPTVYLPDHLVETGTYDKYGNETHKSGARFKGDLFDCLDVQEALLAGGFLNKFSERVRFPRTYHFEFSPGKTSDDKVVWDLSFFEGKEVVVSEKNDGESASLYRKYCHARSLDSANHPSRDWLKGFWGAIAHEIPEGFRICGENMFARHSIAYENLPSYLLGFHVWDDKNYCLGIDDTLEYFELLGITPVRTLYRGVFDLKAIRALEAEMDFNKCEGYVVRLANAFHYRDYRRAVAKFVRPNHVETTQHWMHAEMIKNQLA